jgi:hypothetical protein
MIKYMINKIKIQLRICFLLLSMFTTLRMQAQLSASDKTDSLTSGNTELLPIEEMFLHIDRDKYISGEDIWFSIYNIDTETGKLSTRSIIVYAELLNPWNRPVIQKRLLLLVGRGEGNFALPDSLSSGTYTIRAYTNRMKNFLPDNCFMKNIDIYNPFRVSGFWRKTLTGSSSTNASDFPGENECCIVLKADTIFSRRQKVHLDLELINYDKEHQGVSEMSISVTPAEVSSTNAAVGNKGFSGKKTLLKYLTESDGHYLSGIIKYRDGNVSDSSGFLYMSVQGKVAEFRYSEIDTGRHFSFLLPVDDKFRNLILQPEHANKNMILEIESPFSVILPASNTIRDTINESLLEVFTGLSFNYQVAKIYGIKSKKEADLKDKTEGKKRRFYGIPEMNIFLDDYIKLPSMEEVFIELVPGVILRSKKSGYEMKITNPLTGIFYNEPPLVMIDGVIINDLAVLVNLDPEKVEKIEVVITPYLIGDLILHGIVNVITRSGDFSNVTIPEYAVILPYKIIETPPVIIFPDYSVEMYRLSRAPDLRNTLYWNPSVKTNSNGEAEIEFWTSDLPGIYTINIQGITDMSKNISLHKSFTVK